MFNEYPDILTPADVARALGIGKNTAYKLIRERSIGCLIDYVQSARYQVSKP